MEKLLSVSFLLLPFLSAFSSARLTPDRRSEAKLPAFQAETLIRSLNLFPKEPINIVNATDHGLPRAKAGARLVEKPFKFPNFHAGGDVSVEDLGHYAGYYQIADSYDASMFYFFFESRNSSNDPVVIWLTGGPGCSSELAMFTENGPFKITDDLSLVWNQYGWDQVSNIIYVDQPTGTGFSYTSDSRDIRHDEEGVSDDLYDFIQAFFSAHPEYANNEFYITGESYAGHYIPAFAARVCQGNQDYEGIQINLRGFAMGNGLTDPGIQYPAYPDFALDNGLIDQDQYYYISQKVPQCERATSLCGTHGIDSCLNAYSICQEIFSSIQQIAGNINVYDIRKQCYGSLCYDFSYVSDFLNQQSVRDALGVGDIDWVPCSSVVHQAMLVDWMRNLEVDIPGLLENGLQVLIYAGEDDLICNWLGNWRWVQAMEWSGQQDFLSSSDVSFQVDGSEAGIMKGSGALSFLKIHNAGHLVPMDQPKAALEMLRRFIQGSLS